MRRFAALIAIIAASLALGATARAQTPGTSPTTGLTPAPTPRLAMFPYRIVFSGPHTAPVDQPITFALDYTRVVPSSAGNIGGGFVLVYEFPSGVKLISVTAVRGAAPTDLGPQTPFAENFGLSGASGTWNIVLQPPSGYIGAVSIGFYVRGTEISLPEGTVGGATTEVAPSGATGVPAVDLVLTHLLAGDLDALQALVKFTGVPCQAEPPTLSAGVEPQCPAGTPVGTPIPSFLMLQCEGSYATSNDAVRTAFTNALRGVSRDSLYAVVRVDPPQHGASYVIAVGSEPSPGTSPGTLWYVDDAGNIVALDFGCGAPLASVVARDFASAQFLIGPLGPQPTPTAGAPITGPNTGDGASVARTSGMPLATALALAALACAALSGGLLLRRR